MSWDLNKRLQHLLRWSSNAIDSAECVEPTHTNQPGSPIVDFAEMFISDADALYWIGSKAERESVCPETGGADARKQTENSQGEMLKPKGKAADDQGGWTFHSPESAPDPSRGYLYNAYHRLVAIDGVPDLDLNTFVKPFQAMPNYDEYTEIVVVTPKTTEQSTSRADSNTSTDAWDLYFVDHFNRRFLTLKDFEKSPNEICSGSTTSENAYREWMKLVASGNSHYFMPWPDNKKQCLGRKIAQQIVWDYQTAHVVKDVDIEGAFSISDCSSLLSALQKKRVSDKQCQKIIKAVIQRFLRSTPISQRPEIRQNFDADRAQTGPFTTCGMALIFIAWVGPLLHVPFPYFRRLRLLSTRADEGEYVPDLWKTFIKSVLKEWTDLNIILALILAANVAFLALPGTSGDIPEGKPVILADISRAAGIISMFMTMSGLLTSLCLIWIHSPLRTTGGYDAYRYIIGPSYKSNAITSKELEGHNSFMQLALMASYLGMPLVLLLWSVIAFVVSAATWIFLFSEISTQIITVTVCGFVLISPIITLLVFRGPTTSGESLFSKMLRSQSDLQPV